MISLDSCSIDDLLKKRRGLRRQLLAAGGLQELRLAVLGGSTTDEVVNLVELLLLSNGFRPVFHQSDYGRFYEDAVHTPQALVDFQPDVVYVQTSCCNIQHAPPLNCTEAELPGYLEAELKRYRDMWEALERSLGCQIIQNNFETPPEAVLGNMDAVVAGGRSRFLMALNVAFAQEAADFMQRRSQIELMRMRIQLMERRLQSFVGCCAQRAFSLTCQPARMPFSMCSTLVRPA